MARGDRADHRHHAGADGRVRADGLPGRDHRPALPAVRADHRRHGDHQRHQRVDAQAGAVGLLPPPAPGQEERLLPRRSTGSTTGSPGSTWRSSGAGPRPAAGDGRSSPASWPGRCTSTCSCRPGSCRPRTRGTRSRCVQLPDGASLQRTAEVVDEANDILMHTPGVANVFAIGGFSLLDSTATSNAATFFVVFEPYEERRSEEKSMEAILGHIRGQYASRIKEAVVADLPAAVDPRPGQHRRLPAPGRGQGAPASRNWPDGPADPGRRRRPDGAAGRSTSTFRAGVPQLYADVDRVKAKTLGLRPQRRLRHDAGVPRLGLRQRLQQVRPDLSGARPGRRAVPQRARRTSDGWRSATSRGEMVPLGAIVDVEKIVGPQIISRYNLYPTAAVTGEAAPGYSSGDAPGADGADARSATCPPGMGYEWTGHVVPGEAGQRPGDLGLRPGRAVRLPRAGGAVRELAAAGGGDPRRAAGPARGRRRPWPAAGWTTTSTRRSASC